MQPFFIQEGGEMARGSKKTEDNDINVAVTGTESATPSGTSIISNRTGNTARGYDVMVKPVRWFTDSATGEFRTPSDAPFGVTRRRAADLVANGLVTEVCPVPENKMAPEPEVKE
ncbi:hypothetical protein IFV78_004042 [Salmonella enterica]|nr:hypothetical protein [Salmonella enterica subsp. enterica]EGC4745133.1 hypothetical protein [Salmonella enterica]EHE9077939.1 hypothetical protein [Salmonella enterica]ELG7587921.1 hypothetical protein [Salmonella enterica]ELS5585199.1 hypothetical protein [Salmonella enterica]